MKFWLGLGLLLLASLSKAQDMHSERVLRPMSRWTKESGFDPNVRACQLSKQGHLQCSVDATLLSVECESLHYGKSNLSKAVFQNNSFSCEGTQYDRQSLLFQWRVRLQDVGGAQSVWLVDHVAVEQQQKIYKLELESLKGNAPAKDYFVNVYYSLGESLFSNNSQASQVYGLELEKKRLLILWQRRQISDMSSTYKVGLGWVLEESPAHTSWALRMVAGQEQGYLENAPTNPLKWTSYCLEADRRWRYSGGFVMAGAGHCWWSALDQMSFKADPYLDMVWSHRLIGFLYLRGAATARMASAELGGQSLKVPNLSFSLGASLSFLPN